MSQSHTIRQHRGNIVILLLTGLFGVMTPPASAQVKVAAGQDDVLSVPELLALKSKWSNYAAIQLPIVIEGRLGSRSETQLRLRNCDIRFRAESGKQLPPIASKTENVVLKGFLVKDGSRFAFTVQKLTAQPSDLETFRTRRVNLPLKDHAPWYLAAKWARDRGAFYDDDALRKASQAAAERAIQLERRGLPAGDGAAVLKLVAKADHWKLPSGVSQELTHEAYRLLWNSSQTKNTPTFTEFHTGLVRDLPGATTPLKAFPTKLAVAYAKSALETYRQATKETRPVLHRLFYQSIMQQQIESTAKPDGSNGSAIAASLENLLPDLPDRAESHRRKELAYRVNRIATADRTEAVALAALLTQRKQIKRAAEILRTWLKSQESVLRKDGAVGLVRLSDETQRLLNDRERAIALLKEADQLSPNLESVTSRMQTYGYSRHKDTWLTTEEFLKLPVDPTTRTMRSGQVFKGMSPGEVRRVVAGAPSTVLRSATHRTVSEVWIFQQPDQSRLIVHFRRKRGDPRSQSKVTKSSRLPN